MGIVETLIEGTRSAQVRPSRLPIIEALVARVAAAQVLHVGRPPEPPEAAYTRLRALSLPGDCGALTRALILARRLEVTTRPKPSAGDADVALWALVRDEVVSLEERLAAIPGALWALDATTLSLAAGNDAG
jgi:hypothetical protein